MTLIGHIFSLTHVTVGYPVRSASHLPLSSSLRDLLGWDRVLCAAIWLHSNALILRIILHTDRFRAHVDAGVVIFRHCLGGAADVRQDVLIVAQFLYLPAKALLRGLQV